MNMLGIDPMFITHKLNIDPRTRLVQQMKRKFLREKNEVIKTKVDTLKETKIVKG